MEAQNITIQTPLLTLSNDNSMVHQTDQMLDMNHYLLPIPKTSPSMACVHLALNFVLPPLGLVMASLQDQNRAPNMALLFTAIGIFAVQIGSALLIGIHFTVLNLVVWLWALMLSLLSLCLNMRRKQNLEAMMQEECDRFVQIYGLNDELGEKD